MLMGTVYVELIDFNWQIFDLRR